MEEELQFPCSSCGICCRKIGTVIDEYRRNNNFPYNVKADGSCEMLMDDNRCKVYENRPDCCSIKKIYENNVRHTMTRKEFYYQNSLVCNKWMEEEKADKSLRIDLKYYDDK